MFAYSKIMQGIRSVSAVVTDAYFNLVTLLLNTSSTNGAQNNTFIDSSSNGFSITRNPASGPNAPTQGTFTPFSQTGWGNFFNGSTDYASVGTSLFNYTTANASTQTATIEAWVYTTAYGSPSQTYYSECIIGKGDVYMNFGINGSGNLILAHFDGTQRSVVSTGTVPLNTWTYVACTISAGVVTLYINGSSSGTGTWFGIAAGGQNTASLIGRVSTNASSIYFSGYISNIRVSTNVRTIATPTVAYSSDANTALLTCQSNRFVDNSPSPLTLTLTGSPSVQAFSPFLPTAAYSTSVVGGSGYFDGTGDYLTFGSGQANANLNGNCSIELWFYPTGAAAAGVLTAKYGGTTNQFYVNSQANNLIYCEFLGTTFYAKTSSGSFTRNAWNHLLITKSGTTAKMWLNGVYEGAWTVSTSNSSTDAIGVGATQGGATTFNGYISGIRYSNTATETGTSNITLPTAPLTSNGNTAALLSFTNAGIYDAAAKNVLETVGNAQVSTTQAKFGTTSMYFDGTGDYLQLPSSQLLAMVGDFTIEFWIFRATSSSSSQYVINFGGTGAGNALYVTFDSGGTILRLTNLATVFAQSAAISASTWTHIAIVRNSGSSVIYTNGTAGTAVACSVDFVQSPNYIGGAASVFNGYLDELRITRYARYTANFTAPTAAFPIQ